MLFIVKRKTEDAEIMLKFYSVITRIGVPFFVNHRSEDQISAPFPTALLWAARMFSDEGLWTVIGPLNAEGLNQQPYSSLPSLFPY